MLSTGEKAMISDMLQNNVPVNDIAIRLGRSISTIYNYKRLSDGDNHLHPTLSLRATSIDTGRKYKPASRVETGPGEQAQVDWASCGKILLHDRKQPLYAFLLTLSYSRMMYVEFTVKQNLKTLENCHMNAFEKLGIPKTIRYDNMKTVVLSHKRTGREPPKIVYNPAFLDFARYYKFVPEACPPYWPRSKGKVERSVRYLKDSFIPSANIGKNFISLENLNQQVAEWLQKTSKRTHRTLYKQPITLYQNEVAFLGTVKHIPRYANSFMESRRSTKDGLVAFNGNFYSIPQYLAGKNCSVREVSRSGVAILEIYHEYQKVAEHVTSQERGAWIVKSEHSLPSDAPDTESIPPKNKARSLRQPKNRHEIPVASRTLDYYDI